MNPVPQCVLPVGQLSEGQLLQGWFNLTKPDGTPFPKTTPMLSAILQYLPVNQVTRTLHVTATGPTLVCTHDRVSQYDTGAMGLVVL
jgi:hypothetical protein